MNKEVLLLRSIIEHKDITQRELAAECGIALGSVNAKIKQCAENGLIEKTGNGFEVTGKGLEFIRPYRTEKAVIMAAGFGSRFVPLTLETPKGLLEVFGEPMIERQIKELHEAGVTDITVIVGYMKEKFEYLIDKYGVKLRYNPEFTDKNTLASLYHAADELEGSNCYILSSDNWMKINLYHSYEPCAWYASQHAKGRTSEWVLESDAKGRITDTYPGGMDCDYMYGPAYFSKEFSEEFVPVLKKYYEMLNGTAKKRLIAYFGNTPENKIKAPVMYVNRQPDGVIYEFENLEELRSFDKKYVNDSGSEAMQLVSRVFNVPESDIKKIRCLKSGMTNNSWLFSIGDESYISRIPGEGTDKLINRRQEKAAYDAVRELGITEELIYFNPDTGCKISRFYENSRNAAARSEDDLKACMKLLKGMHDSGVSVEHEFDIEERIGWYERLIDEVTAEDDPDYKNHGIPFRDYSEVSKVKDELLRWLKERNIEKCLSHIDPVVDNFIFLPDGTCKLIDWEYAGMCNRYIDIAMCAIYSFMNEEKMRNLTTIYFGRDVSEEEQKIVFAYAALGGMLWSLWGVYKEKLGVQFTDYTLKMYRYMKEYSKKVLG
ncbi:MAG: NTP transferase domain-containing protein [Eubacteriales bacterium]|nr:NTP transferase domain-containing protein [Eubacteriales bacterium]